MSARILWGIIVVLAVALAAWYITTERTTGSNLGQPATATASTTPAANATTTENAAPQLPPTMPSADTATIKNMMIGTWQSIDDGNYHVKVTVGGKWIDSYGTSTSAIQTGAYTLFTSAASEKDLPIPAQPSVVYLKVVEGHSIFYYSVLEVSTTTLQISYLARGNTLAFVRVQ